MKVAWLNPPWHGTDDKSEHWYGVRAGSRWPFSSKGKIDYNTIRYTPYPLFLAFCCSYVAKAIPEAEIWFHDSIALCETYAEFFSRLQQFGPDYAIIETASPSFDHDAKIIAGIVNANPKVKIIITGPIAASRGEEILAKYPVHAVVKGEYERGVVRVLKGESGLIDFDIMTQEEMTQAPFPYMDDKHWNRYWDSNPKNNLYPQLQAWTSRGCPFRCIWCSWPANMTNADPSGSGKRAIRYYSEDYLEAYFKEVTGRYAYKSIYLDGDTENLGDAHTLMVCRVMRKISLPWSIMARADTIKRETWKAMKDAGCTGCKIGFESGVQRIIDDVIHKNLNLKEAVATAKYIQSLGMTVHGTFSLGAPGETKEEMIKTLEFIKSIGLDSHQVSGVAEIEGTPLATLMDVGRLPKYPSAKVDNEYIREADGSVKLQKLVDSIKRT